MVKENYFPHPSDKALEYFQESGQEKLNLYLVGVYVKHFHFESVP